MILCLTQFSLNEDHQHLSCQCHGYHFQIGWLRWTNSVRSISLYPRNGRCSQIIENSKIGMSRHLDSSTTTQMAYIMVQYRRPSRCCWAKSVRSSCGRPYGKGKLRRSFWSMAGRKFQIGSVSSYIVKKDYPNLCMWSGRGRGRCPHTLWSRSSAGFPWSSCWAPAAARHWGGRRRSGRQTGGKAGK